MADTDVARGYGFALGLLTQFQTTKQTVYLVTNILDEKVLSDSQLVETYKLHWGVEPFFRTFKQTFGRRKLRSRSAENAPLELDWSLLACPAVLSRARA